MSIYDDVFNIIAQYTKRQWKIDGRLAHPNSDDVYRLMSMMLEDIRNTGYNCIESGGIMVKRDGHKIDVYVHIGELDENNSI